MRICINIAITEMVVSLNETSEKSENNEYCPKINEQTPQINATTVNKELYEWSEYTQVNFYLIFTKFQNFYSNYRFF